jgi:hypothetical protein
MPHALVAQGRTYTQGGGVLGGLGGKTRHGAPRKRKKTLQQPAAALRPKLPDDARRTRR